MSSVIGVWHNWRSLPRAVFVRLVENESNLTILTVKNKGFGPIKDEMDAVFVRKREFFRSLTNNL